MSEWTSLETPTGRIRAWRADPHTPPRGALVSVDLMLRLSKGAWRSTVRGIITGVNLAFLSVVIWFGIDLVNRIRFQTFASMDLSMGWAYAALPVGGLLGVVAVIAHHLDPHDDELSTAQ